MYRVCLLRGIHVLCLDSPVVHSSMVENDQVQKPGVLARIILPV